MKIGTVSESLEDYLLIIHQLKQENQQARVKDIAASKGVKMSSVTAALKRLARQGLIVYSARETVEITAEGEVLVRRLMNRREQVKRFLERVLGVPSEFAREDAGGIEHHVSLETLDRLAAFIGFLDNSSISRLEIPLKFARYYNQCLIGPLSDASAHSVEHFKQVCLDSGDATLLELQPGERGIVKKILARSAIRQRLIDMGFLPNVVVLMERVAPLGDPIEVKIKGFHISLRKDEAARILIDPVEENGSNAK